MTKEQIDKLLPFYKKYMELSREFDLNTEALSKFRECLRRFEHFSENKLVDDCSILSLDAYDVKIKYQRKPIGFVVNDIELTKSEIQKIIHDLKKQNRVLNSEKDKSWSNFWLQIANIVPNESYRSIVAELKKQDTESNFDRKYKVIKSSEQYQRNLRNLKFVESYERFKNL